MRLRWPEVTDNGQLHVFVHEDEQFEDLVNGLLTGALIPLSIIVTAYVIHAVVMLL